jgi:hypothetical protein
MLRLIFDESTHVTKSSIFLYIALVRSKMRLEKEAST